MLLDLPRGVKGSLKLDLTINYQQMVWKALQSPYLQLRRGNFQLPYITLLSAT